MRIPTQSDRSRATCGEHPDDAAVLRARRQHLVGQLRSVGYWQRLVQARTDLLVAALLYCAPVPAPLSRTGWPGGDDDTEPVGLATPPAGLDLRHLLGGSTDDSPGARLGGLREVALELGRRRRALQEDLDVVTTALHRQLARDGAAAVTASAVTASAVTPAAVTPAAVTPAAVTGPTPV